MPTYSRRTPLSNNIVTMSESNQAADELFEKTATEKPESKPDPSSEEAESGSGDAEAKAEENVSKGEIERKKMINSWKLRVENGEVEAEDIPVGWIRDELTKTRKPKEDLNETVRKAIQAEKETERYSEMRERLNELGLSEEKRRSLASEYQDLLDSGLSKAKALEKAVKIAGIRLESPDRFAARIPKPSTRKVEAGDEIKSKLEEGEFPSDVPMDKRVEHWEKLRKSH